MVALRPSGRPPASKPTFVWHLGQLRYAPGDIRPNSSQTAVSPHFAQAYLLPGVGGRSLTGAVCARREQRQLPTWRLPIKRRQRAPSTAPLANPGADQGWNWTPGTTRRDLLRAPWRATFTLEPISPVPDDGPEEGRLSTGKQQQQAVRSAPCWYALYPSMTLRAPESSSRPKKANDADCGGW